MPETVSIPDYLTLEELAVQYGPVTLQKPLSKAVFVALSERYPDLPMERETDGSVTIISPVKKGTGRRKSKLFALLAAWLLQAKNGEIFGSTTGFDLPDGSNRSPDIAWVSDVNLATDPASEEEFLRIVPDFVVEIRSSSDNSKKLRRKMTDTWMANGVRLAWPIDPYDETVRIYRQGKSVEEWAGFDGRALSGEAVLPGFTLPLELMKRAQ